MSEAIYDPVAYTTLTDSIIHQILVSTDPQLQEVRMYTLKFHGTLLCANVNSWLCKFFTVKILRICTVPRSQSSY